MPNRVVLNVGGSRYEVSVQTLQKFPNSLLGQMFCPNSSNWPQPDQDGTYFFDRNGRAFEFILDYYRSDCITPPIDLSEQQVINELNYWRLDDTSYLSVLNSNVVEAPKEENHLQELLDDDAFFNLSIVDQYEYASTLIHNTDSDLIKLGICRMKAIQSVLTSEEINKEFEENERMIEINDINDIDGINRINKIKCENIPNPSHVITLPMVLFSLLFGFYRLGNIQEAKRLWESLNSIDPDSSNTKLAKTLIQDTSNSYIRSGLFFLALLGLSSLIGIQLWGMSRKREL